MLGSHVTTIAYPLLVLRLTGSPFTAGCAAFAATAPSVLVYIPAGALVDRWDPRRAMLLSELGRGLAIASVAVTLAIGKPIVTLLIAVAVIEGVLEVFSGLAERRYIGSFVEPGQARSALAGMEARTHVVLVAGRPLGGLLFGIEPILPFLADVASFVYSVFTLSKIGDAKSRWKPLTPARRPTSDGSLINQIRQGLQWIRDDKFARMAMLSYSTGTLIFQALIMVFLVDAHNLHFPPLGIGTVLAASGVGGALGSVAASRLLPRISYPWIQIQAWIWIAGFCFIALPIGRHFIYIAMIMAVLGFTGALGNISLDTHLMQNVDKEMLARVTSVGRLASFAACAIGPFLGGALAQGLGVPTAMSCLFLFTPLLLVLSVLTPRQPGGTVQPPPSPAWVGLRLRSGALAQADPGNPESPGGVVAGAPPVHDRYRHIADHPGVVPRRQRSHLARGGVELGAVGRADPQCSGDVVLEVRCLAQFGAGHRLDVLGPSPARLEGQPPDLAAPDMQQF